MPLRIDIPRANGENRKILTITHADTDKHLVNLTMINNREKLRAIVIGAHRTGGTGSLEVYPMEGTAGTKLTGQGNLGQLDTIPVFIKHGRLQYSLIVANDTFDIYLFACYWKEA